MHGKKDESSDMEFINAFLTQVGCDKSNLKTIKRIGAIKPDRARPILIQLNTEEEKSRVMNNLRELKDVQMFTGISITEYYTLAD